MTVSGQLLMAASMWTTRQVGRRVKAQLGGQDPTWFVREMAGALDGPSRVHVVAQRPRKRRDVWATLVAMAGRTYAENRPYLLPGTLGELTGPVTGVIQLPLRLDWSERTEFHLDDLAERNVMYERVIREATRVDDLRSYLNEDVLRQVWGGLFLPARVRRSWEDRFPELRLAA
jgi:hypothetical protein